ncbi:MAG: hypothetical protein LBL90_13250 [Prevotellaceae bacterium]|jgi:hypothetical protein|nr:hypothetical protein [Prevotellaceae bacterium]
MIKLTAEYSANLQFNLKINNSLTGGTYVDDQNNEIIIQAKARGFYIMRRQLRTRHILSIDLKDKKFTPGKNPANMVKLPTVNMKDKILDILGRDIEVITIEPDTLYLNYSVPSSKRVPVVKNFTLSFQREYMQTAPAVFEPDSITITGQQEILDTINVVYTVYQNFLHLNDKLETTLSLKEIENVAFSHRKVKINIPVERCTESNIKLPIVVLNVPLFSSILLLPSQVEVKYIVALKDYPHINIDDFYATVDYLHTDSSASIHKLRVILTSKPHQVISVKLSPEFVDFIQHRE